MTYQIPDNWTAAPSPDELSSADLIKMQQTGMIETRESGGGLQLRKRQASDPWPAILTHLWRGGQWGYYWTLPDKVTQWRPADNPGAIPTGKHVYYGVNPANERGMADERARIGTIAAVNCVFAEFDAKDYGGDKAATLAHVDGLAVSPSVVIDSGGGYHCYWFLRSPFIFAEQADRDRARQLQAAWVAYVGGDGGAKDLARVLRVPGTVNSKYNPPRPVTILRADLARLYTIGDLETAAKPPTSPNNRQPTTSGNGRGPSDDAGQHWLDKALARYVPHGGEFSRNHTGLWLACQLRDNGMSEAEAEGWLLAYARTVSAPGDPYGDGEALASLRSAYHGGPKREKAKGAATRAAPAPKTTTAKTTPAQAAAAPQAGQKKTIPTDDDLYRRWLVAHPDTAWGIGEFRRYTGGIWPIVPLDMIRKEILRVLEAAKPDGIRPTARLLNSVTELARVQVGKAAEEWDADHETLICKNGALHIPTRTLHSHSPTHYATSRLSFDYDPAARAPVWRAVLDRCVPEAQGFLQEFAGYALTTETKYEIAVWLAGQPGGGKSTILEGLRAMLGERVCLLGLSDIEKSRFALTNLPGKTLAISTEQPGGYVAAAQVLNEIISGEPITVDRKFKDPVTIVPRAKIAWALNELPRVGAEGAGLFRRVKVLKLPAIPEAERDPNIKEAVKLEGAGILNWALDGLARLTQRGRFDVPAKVKEATEHFRETNDIPGVFVAECCVTGNDETGKPYRTQASILYNFYAVWCKDNGHKAQSSTSIAEDWRRLGFEKRPSGGRNYWEGVGIAPAPTDDQDENEAIIL